ncbi:MAG: PHP domain-containing protein [Deltaproteobacteria bacterium]|nr:PHP domain-containing protein [Deltaproteobacteria bacterium]
MTPQEIFKEASKRGVGILSITDHDSIDCQEEAKMLADEYHIIYFSGLELSVFFSHPSYMDSKPVSLDFLAYEYDLYYQPLVNKLKVLREHRKKRAEQILEKINQELIKENLQKFSHKDLEAIESSVDGAFGRPHIADYMIKKGIVSNKQEAFEKYLVRCNVPKMPLSLSEAHELVKGAGGKMILAHPNHPRGTSLVKFTTDLEEQQRIITEAILPYIDGIECWHSAHDRKSTQSYLEFAKNMKLMVTGGSDCHQQPLLIGTVDVPDYVAQQFGPHFVKE